MGFSPGIVERLEFRTPSEKDVTVLQESADIYYSNLTIIRTGKGLQDVLDFVDRNAGTTNVVVRNRLTIGSILATAELMREESRGTHYREDFPGKNPVWGKRIVVSRGEGDAPKVEFLS